MISILEKMRLVKYVEKQIRIDNLESFRIEFEDDNEYIKRKNKRQNLFPASLEMFLYEYDLQNQYKISWEYHGGYTEHCELYPTYHKGIWLSKYDYKFDVKRMLSNQDVIRWTELLKNVSTIKVDARSINDDSHRPIIKFQEYGYQDVLDQRNKRALAIALSIILNKKDYILYEAGGSVIIAQTDIKFSTNPLLIKKEFKKW